MNTPSRGLGRGLASLLGGPASAAPPASKSALPLTAIEPGASQPRRAMESQPLEELAASIRANGVIQPIVVRPIPGDRYEIVAGERRWQAAKLAGLSEIPVVIRELTDSQAVAVALIENIQREELTPAEEARALQRLIGEFNLTHQEVANAVGRSRAAVTNLIRLLDLPAAVVDLIDSKAISMGHARALLGLNDDREQTQLAQQIAARGLSVRETENLVRKALTGKIGVPPAKLPDLTVVSEVLRTPTVHVQLHQKASGNARIVIDVNDAQSRDVILRTVKEALGE